MTNELQIELRKAGYEAGFGLSELIEACGYKFDGLQINHGENNADKRWQSYGIGGINAYGSTPEEAVARLYLQLKKDSVSIGK